MYAIRDKENDVLHSDRYISRDDAEDALHEIAYEFEMESDEFDVVEVK